MTEKLRAFCCEFKGIVLCEIGFFDTLKLYVFVSFKFMGERLVVV